jgi:hypothetical protein
MLDCHCADSISANRSVLLLLIIIVDFDNLPLRPPRRSSGGNVLLHNLF